MSLIKFIIGMAACILLWIGADYGRNEKLRFGSKDHLVVMVLFVIAVIVIGNLDKWIE